MTELVKNVYKMAVKDDEFNEEMVKSNPDNKRPKWYNDDIIKNLYASIYCGWLLGKGKHDILKEQRMN